MISTDWKMLAAWIAAPKTARLHVGHSMVSHFIVITMIGANGGIVRRLVSMHQLIYSHNWRAVMAHEIRIARAETRRYKSNL